VTDPTEPLGARVRSGVRLLDLFCCAGGASEGYRQAGFGDGYPDLIALTRKKLRAAGVPFVIKNVVGARSSDRS